MIKKTMSNVLLANISWNAFDWKRPYVNPYAGHEYARTHPGHESLNFDFDKEFIDDEVYIKGFVQWTNSPVNFQDGGLVIFYSQNTEKKEGEIVGVYGNVQVLTQPERYNRNDFLNNVYTCNLRAEKQLSLLFPIKLPADNFKEGNLSVRLVGENGFTYKDISFAEKVLVSELNQLIKKNISGAEFDKLVHIYTYYTGKEFLIRKDAPDEIQQEELQKHYSNVNLEQIKSMLTNIKPQDPQLILVNGKVYKRDNRTVAMIKVLRNFECQLCKKKIKKKDGSFYIEAAHIDAKHDKGAETPDNILILCPNHHKEFDFGNREFLSRSKNKVVFKLNDHEYEVDLSI